ncbi:TCR gamma alternate reading frame protein isoform X6 [Piliocolobus tephrosceles]|uniref:TCR gamma alternate reading frame protein isoform X6 n=1 Tax=Piliocolobus tephrosceles TaxID=591936 RepID=UPI000E6B1DE6|nr:TCR gamma alternate reading frame protein isoform X6 [Piliocolobus tephrosceles]
MSRSTVPPENHWYLLGTLGICMTSKDVTTVDPKGNYSEDANDVTTVDPKDNYSVDANDALLLQLTNTSAYYTYLLLLLKSKVYFAIIAVCLLRRTAVCCNGERS